MLVNEIENFEKVIDGLEEQRVNTLADEVIRQTHLLIVFIFNFVHFIYISM